MLNKYLCFVEYDGSHYSGWAAQKNKPTIQGTINECLTHIYKQPIKIVGASRTDAKVHAIDQAFCFNETKANLSPKQVMTVLNRLLPLDIRIKKIKKASDSFHPQHDAISKTYCYKINDNPFSQFNNPFYSHYIYLLNQPIDLAKLKHIATVFVGKHDFKSFSKSELTDTIRTINWIKINRKNDLIYIQINGNGFLRNMVRMIVAAMIKYSFNQKSESQILELLNHPSKGKTVDIAPACGLYLTKINYPR